MSDEMWTQKDGTTILVDNMTENHVRNALKLVIRRQHEYVRTVLKAYNSVSLFEDYRYDPNE